LQAQLGGATAAAELDPKMIKLRPYVPSKRIAIRDSSIDEDASDDVEDEVFIKDARSAKVSTSIGNHKGKELFQL